MQDAVGYGTGVPNVPDVGHTPRKMGVLLGDVGPGLPGQSFHPIQRNDLGFVMDTEPVGLVGLCGIYVDFGNAGAVCLLYTSPSSRD